jgi:hypothetical protein
MIAEARDVLQSVTDSLAQPQAESKETELLQTARNLLQSYLAALPASPDA